MERKEFKINNTEDVARFFFWIVFDARINFHPDDSFTDYISYETGEATFSREDALYYDTVMEKCFNVCKESGVDIYDISIEVFDLYGSTQKPETI